ncbi:MAG: hypothetical protein OSA51_12450 [Octadecabacter sp.]|nr:hypothetical protein [Octadecabacter sp.]
MSRTAAIGRDRSEGPLSVLHVDMCATQHLSQTARTDGCRERPIAAFGSTAICSAAAFVLLPFMQGAAFLELKRQSTDETDLQH